MARRIDNSPPADYRPTQDQEFNDVEPALQNLRTQRLSEYRQPVYIASMAKPNLQSPDNTLFPLIDKVKDFLADDCQVMLILGDLGAGKSTFNRHLEYKLWQDYTTGDRIPLFINLPALERPEKDLVAEQLRIYGLLDDQIRELKLYRQFMLICDGYDESQLTSNLHTTNLLNRSGQWDAKLLITCRTQYLGPDYRGRFVPKAFNQYHQNANNLFREAVIAPFSNDQIGDYVELYVPLEPRTWVKENYMDKLEKIPNLMDLARNPFLLTLCLEALPHVVQDRSNLSRLRVTRVQLYDAFVQHWLGVNKRRLQDLKLSGDKFLAFEELLEDGFEQNGMRFQQDLAAAIFREQQGRPVVEHIHKRDRSSWKASFFSSDLEITLLRDASLLNRVGTQYRFVHLSILEYFYSCTMYTTPENNDKFAPHPRVGSSDVDNHPLSKRNLVREPSIIQFLAERVQMDHGFKQQLLDLIEQSKADEHAACAATNAITILVKAGVRFNGADLRGIRVPGADLSEGQFDSAQLQEADLSSVNLTRSWIRQADFTGANMEGVQFGELPFLEEIDWVHSCAFSIYGTLFAVGLDGGRIHIYNSTTWMRIRILFGHENPVRSIAFSPSGEQFLSGGDDNMVRLWNCHTGLTDFILNGHTGGVNVVAFSPSGGQIASASDDETVRILDPRTGAILFVLQGHTGSICSIAYSPDGQGVVSVDASGAIRIFDTLSGQTRLVLGNGGRCVSCVAYSSDGLCIAAGDIDGMLLLWKSAIGKLVKHWRGHASRINDIDFSPNGQWIVSSSDDYTVKPWDAHTGSLVSVFAGHSDSVGCVVFAPNSMQLASGSEDGTVRLWDLTTAGVGLGSDDGHSDVIMSVAYSLDGSSLVTSCDTGVVRQYDVGTGEPRLVIHCKPSQANSVAISLSGHQIAVAGWSKNIQLWNSDTGETVFTFQSHADWIETLTFSPNGQWIASSSGDDTVSLWNACSGTSGLVLSGHDSSVVTVTFSPCGLQVVSVSVDGAVRVWDIGTGESRVAVGVGRHFGSLKVVYSPNGIRIALARRKRGCLELWGDESEDAICSLQDKRVDTVALSLRDQWIATGRGNSLRLWNLTARETSQKRKYELAIRGFLGKVNDIAWRPGALEFVTGTAAGSVQTWKVVDASDGQFSTRLVWSSGRSILNATDTIITNAGNLSATNQRLLNQRGARIVSLSS
jgi:WD40 repeat protein